MQLAKTVSTKFGFSKNSNDHTREADVPVTTKPPEWEDDQTSEDCCCCLIKFTVTRRKHHCRKCGRIVCGACSNYRSSIPEMGFLQPVRICVDCNCAIQAEARGINLQAVAEYIISETRPKVTRTAQERLNAVQIEEAKQTLADLKVRIREHELKLEKAHREHSVIDMLDYSQQMNALVQEISATTELLRTARSNLGQVVMGVVATEHAEFTDSRHQRYLVVTPGPDVIVAISGLNCNGSQNRNACFRGGLRFMCVHTMDEVLKVRRCKIQVLSGGGKGQVLTKMLPALHILWDTPAPSADEDTPSPRPSHSGVVDIQRSNSSSSVIVQSLKSTVGSSSTEFYITSDVSEQARNPGQPASKSEEDVGKGMYEALQSARRKHFDRVTIQKRRLDVLSRLKEKTVSWSDPNDANVLRELWKALRPNNPFPGQKSEQWKDLGFQGADPVTDFRGMGALSPHCLVYWAKAHPQYSNALIAQQHNRNYPIATAAINVCSLVAELSGLNNSRNASLSPLFRVYCRTATDEESSNYFEQVVCVCLALLDFLFVKANAGYMDFPKILASVREILASAASINPLNFSELMGIVHESFVSSVTEGQENIVVKPAWPTTYARQSIALTERKMERLGSDVGMDLTKSLYSSTATTHSDSDSKKMEKDDDNLTPTSSYLGDKDYTEGSSVALSELYDKSSPQNQLAPPGGRRGEAKSVHEPPTREQRVSVYFDPPVTPRLPRSQGTLDLAAAGLGIDDYDDDLAG